HKPPTSRRRGPSAYPLTPGRSAYADNDRPLTALRGWSFGPGWVGKPWRRRFSNGTLRVVVTLPSGTVTFLFSDIEGSTRLWDDHPDAMRDALAQHDDLM